MTGSSGRITRPRRRRLLLAGVAVAALLGAACTDAPVESSLGGTVEFGTGGSGCRVDGPASSFPAGVASVYDVAHFAREARAGEVVVFTVARDGVELASVPRTFDVAGDCLGGVLPGSLLTPGRYRIELVAGADTLAAGEFVIGP